MFIMVALATPSKVLEWNRYTRFIFIAKWHENMSMIENTMFHVAGAIGVGFLLPVTFRGNITPVECIYLPTPRKYLNTEKITRQW